MIWLSITVYSMMAKWFWWWYMVIRWKGALHRGLTVMSLVMKTHVSHKIREVLSMNRNVYGFIGIKISDNIQAPEISSENAPAAFNMHMRLLLSYCEFKRLSYYYTWIKIHIIWWVPNSTHKKITFFYSRPILGLNLFTP